MNKQELILYWQNFFSDLLLGTFKNIFLFGSAGFALGMAATWVLDNFYIDPSEWNAALEWLVLIVALAWYALLGTVHGLGASLLSTAGKKLKEAVNGLHDLLDILVKSVFSNFTKLNKTTPKEELAQKFDQAGQKFLEELKLKRGVFNFIKGLIFKIILKILKFLFLDDIVNEIRKKPGDEITQADVESAVRRVGIEFLLSAIHDNILILHILNVMLLMLTFGLPFSFFWMF